MTATRNFSHIWRDELQRVVADSTFYLCFLEDIERPTVLNQILGWFSFFMPQTVFDEVSKCDNFQAISMESKGKISVVEDDVGRVLLPLFSSEQWKKGEAKCIALAFVLRDEGNLWRLILDDLQARSFVERSLSSIMGFVSGTLGFILICYEQKLMTKEEAMATLFLIGKSSFRATSEVLSNITKQIEG